MGNGRADSILDGVRRVIQRLHGIKEGYSDKAVEARNILLPRRAAMFTGKSLGVEVAILQIYAENLWHMPPPPPVDVEQVADLLTSIGWKATGDAQWDNLKESLPRLANLLGASNG